MSNNISSIVDSSGNIFNLKDTFSRDQISKLKQDFTNVSADHESRITENERAIELLSSAVHFRGVISKSEIEKTEDDPTETEIKTALVKKFKPCIKGDVAIYTDAGTEYIYISDTPEVIDGWQKLGDEGNYVSKATYTAKMTELDSTDTTLCGMIQDEENRAKGIESSIISNLQTLSSAHYTFVETTYAADKSNFEDANKLLNSKVDNKIKTGTYGSALTNRDVLSVMKIVDEDYYKLVAEGKTNDDILYIISSDYINGHDQRIINVGNAISATDAVNLSGMTAAIDTAKQEIVENSLSGVALNGVGFIVSNNIATLSIDIINCGGAN